MPAKDQIITLAILEKETPGITEFIKEKYNTTNPEQTWKSLGAFQRSNDKKNFEVAKRGFKKTGPKEGQRGVTPGGGVTDQGFTESGYYSGL